MYSDRRVPTFQRTLLPSSSTLIMGAAGSSETSYLSTRLHGVTSEKTVPSYLPPRQNTHDCDDY